MRINFESGDINEIKKESRFFLENLCVKTGDDFFCKKCGNTILSKWLTVQHHDGVSNHLAIPYCPQCEKDFKVGYVPCLKKQGGS
ncbi:hypothetical protein C4572_00195 [Candidatus Parcubacteria bacterium]|nr:MAG: hypothetical protein C4572_00195 [Candidatus Parcubacteria bacterium]